MAQLAGTSPEAKPRGVYMPKSHLRFSADSAHASELESISVTPLEARCMLSTAYRFDYLPTGSLNGIEPSPDALLVDDGRAVFTVQPSPFTQGRYLPDGRLLWTTDFTSTTPAYAFPLPAAGDYTGGFLPGEQDWDFSAQHVTATGTVTLSGFFNHLNPTWYGDYGPLTFGPGVATLSQPDHLDAAVRDYSGPYIDEYDEQYSAQRMIAYERDGSQTRVLVTWRDRSGINTATLGDGDIVDVDTGEPASLLAWRGDDDRNRMVSAVYVFDEHDPHWIMPVAGQVADVFGTLNTAADAISLHGPRVPSHIDPLSTLPPFGSQSLDSVARLQHDPLYEVGRSRLAGQDSHGIQYFLARSNMASGAEPTYFLGRRNGAADKYSQPLTSLPLDLTVSRSGYSTVFSRDGTLRLFDPSLHELATLASPSLLQLAYPDPHDPYLAGGLYEQVGISDDGKIVAFVANMTAGGSRVTELPSGLGLFASVLIGGSRRLVRLAPPAPDGILDNGERWEDSNGNDTVDLAEDRGPVSIAIGNRVAVGTLVAGGSSYRIFFANSASDEIWSTDVSITDQTITSGSPQQVVKLGQDHRLPGSDLSFSWIRLARQSVNSAGQVLIEAKGTDGGRSTLVRLTALGQRPVLVVPGIVGSFGSSLTGNWLFRLGVQPQELQLDPVAQVYNDSLTTFVSHGFILDDGGSGFADLFPAAYDWRVPVAPADGAFDGRISGITAASLADQVFAYGVDYLAYWLQRAADKWRSKYNAPLDAVDIIAHSMGGLVARAYIQSPSYGSQVGTQYLPRVANFVSIGVPNRGASKAWNPLHDNWIADPVYQMVLAKMADVAFDHVRKGGAILGPDGTATITSASITVHGELSTTAFISNYVPSLRGLLATYAFLDREGDDLYLPVNKDEEERNQLLLDLNAGMDPSSGRDWVQYDRNAARRTRTGLPDTSRFAGLTNATVLYGAGESTFEFVDGRRGPSLLDWFNVHQMRSIFARPAWPHEVWFKDIGSDDGDGTVPEQSSRNPFWGDGRVTMIGFTRRSQGDGSPYGRESRGPNDHVGLMSNQDVLKEALHAIGIVPKVDSVKTGTGRTDWWSALKPLIASIRIDPVSAYIADAQGRRVGWLQDHGGLAEIPNSYYTGDAEGIGWILGPTDGTLNLVVIGSGEDHVVEASVRTESATRGIESSGVLEAGTIRQLKVPESAAQSPADSFIQQYEAAAAGGLVRGDWIAGQLSKDVPNVAFGEGYWGGQNYWFQTSNGDVWSLWHGGPVHALPDLPGEHAWVLTNLSEAAGLSGQLSFDSSSLSGIATGWNAFSVQGIANGRLFSLWWSPASSAGTFIDVDGSTKKGLSMGLRGNGWVLSDLTSAWVDTDSGVSPTAMPQFRGFSESQGNGRTSYDPRLSRFTANDGMSVTLVGLDRSVYVASFTPKQASIPGALPLLDGKWVVEPLGRVPSVAWLGIDHDLMHFLSAYQTRSGG